MKIIHKIAAVVVKDNTFLIVRKVGSDVWTSLGGKPEIGETEEQTLKREIKEEVNCDAHILRKLGDFEAKAAEDDAIIRLSTYPIELIGNIDLIDPELEEYQFIEEGYASQGIILPESLEKHILPYCIQEGLLSW